MFCAEDLELATLEEVVIETHNVLHEWSYKMPWLAYTSGLKEQGISFLGG